MSDINIEPNKQYSIPEVAKLISVTNQTVSKYLREGKLKGIKRGPKRKWFVKGSEIKKLMESWNMI